MSLQNLYSLSQQLTGKSLNEKLQAFCEYFLGISYGPWLDGTSVLSLDDFNYDLEILDCVTYVEVVLALATIGPQPDLDNFKAAFENLLQNLHYANGEPSFMARNHFMCIDWIKNNKYIITDITNKISSDYKTAIAMIDKQNFIKQHAIAGDKQLVIAPIESRLKYIAINKFLDSYREYYNKFPEFSIINIVRPNWDLTEQIGSHLNISHLGFVFKYDQELRFYHSTVIQKKVVHEPLFDYIARYQQSPTIKGLNVLAIKPDYHAR